MTFPIDDEITKAIPAYGPDGLKSVLEKLLTESNKEHLIRYEIGMLKSLIKVDTSKAPAAPVIVQYSDPLNGRPATENVKKIIADFLWEKCGDNKRYKTREEFDEQLFDSQLTNAQLEEKKQFIDIGKNNRRKSTAGGKNFGIDQNLFRFFGNSNAKSNNVTPENKTESTPAKKN